MLIKKIVFVKSLKMPALIFLFLCLNQCKKATHNVVPNPAPTPTDTITLKSVAPFKVGAAIDVYLLQSNSLYKNILLKEIIKN